MRLGKNSILGENEVDFPTIKRIVSGVECTDIMRFLILKTFRQTFFKTHECYDFLWYNGSVGSEIFILFENLFKPRQRRLAVDMVTDFISLIYNLKTVF